jgi:hypothetical protein
MIINYCVKCEKIGKHKVHTTCLLKGEINLDNNKVNELTEKTFKIILNSNSTILKILEKIKKIKETHLTINKNTNNSIDEIFLELEKKKLNLLERSN